MLSFGGTLVCVGMPEGSPLPIGNSFPSAMVAGMYKIVGSAVGNRGEAAEVLEMATRGIVKFPVRQVGMSSLQSVFEEMGEGKVAGRVVIDLTRD